jgi:Bacterial PH domain
MKQIFPIVPAGNGPIWFFVGFSIFLLGLIALFGYLIYSSRNTSFAIESGELKISGDIYGRRIPLSSLQTQNARIVNLNVDREYRMKWRTDGTGLPGYSAGWFRLYNGDKCLAFVTNRSQVLYLPTTNGYSLLLSVKDPEAFIRALRHS